jgi:Flp pilus assembly protein TadG
MSQRKEQDERIGAKHLLQDRTGQSMVEIACFVPILMLLMGYAIDFGYFFIAAAVITSSARNATEYSIQGFQGPAQGTLPAAGPSTTTTSVAATALADLTGLVSSGTTTTVEVCSKANGMNGNVPNCTSYGPTGTTYTPAADPEAPRFVMQRVDVTYTVQPPIPMTFFKVTLLPSLKFHRVVCMRAMD